MTAQGEAAPPGLPARRLSAGGPERGAPLVCFFLAKILTCAAYDTGAGAGWHRDADPVPLAQPSLTPASAKVAIPE